MGAGEVEHRVANWDEAGADWRKFKHAAMTIGTPPADGIAPASWADAEARHKYTHMCVNVGIPTVFQGGGVQTR